MSDVRDARDARHVRDVRDVRDALDDSDVSDGSIVSEGRGASYTRSLCGGIGVRGGSCGAGRSGGLRGSPESCESGGKGCRRFGRLFQGEIVLGLGLGLGLGIGVGAGIGAGIGAEIGGLVWSQLLEQQETAYRNFAN